MAAIINPIAVVPVFLDLTADFDPKDRARTARLTGLAVAGLLVSSALAGEAVLRFMGTSLPAFRVGGGLVLLIMAIGMLTAKPDRDGRSAASGDGPSSVAIVPVAMPLLAGPGAISATIIQVHRGTGFLHGAFVIAAILLVATVCWAVLHHADRIGRLVGPVGLNVIVRLFGLVLAAIAVETIANGLKGLFPILNG